MSITNIEIPISFNFKERNYSGFLSPAHGSGAHVYHIMINNFYYGRVRFSNNQWHVDTNDKSKDWKQLTDYFGETITAWFQ